MTHHRLQGAVFFHMKKGLHGESKGPGDPNSEERNILLSAIIIFLKKRED